MNTALDVLRGVLLNWCYIIVLMCIVWGIYYFSKNSTIIDVFWPISITISGFHFLLFSAVTPAAIICMILLLLWAARLSGYLFINRFLKKHTDQRYEEISNQWKRSKAFGYFFNFQLQGVLAILIAVPFLFTHAAADLNILQLIGFIMVLIGIVGEAIADKQLHQFKLSGTKGVCDLGLWKYSRHPNYFFEWLIWLGFAFSGLLSDYGVIGLISPLLLLYLMLKITGPITEKASVRSRGKEYVNYQCKTSMFIPWFTKKR